MRLNDQDVNEAKESLKLLKQKVNINSTSTTNKFSGLSNNLGGLNNNININVPNTSHNYRKVFKPNLGMNENNEATSKISSQQSIKQTSFPSKTSNFTMNNNSNNNEMLRNTNTTNKFNYNSSKNSSASTTESRINKNVINPNFGQPPMKKNGAKKFQIDEIEDDRPAFAQGRSDE